MNDDDDDDSNNNQHSKRSLGFWALFWVLLPRTSKFFFVSEPIQNSRDLNKRTKKTVKKRKKNCFHLYFFSCKTKDFHLSRIKLVKKTKQRKLLWTLFMNTSSSSSSSCMNRKQSQTMHTIERMFWNKLNFQTTVRLSANLQMDNEKNNKRMERKNGK